MIPFLRNVAQQLLEKHSDFHKIGVILPSRRAAVFLKKEMASLTDKPLLAPYLSTTEDFLLENLGWEQENMPGLIFKLYRAYLQLDLDKKDDFTDFSKWAQTLIGDFNEVDRHLTDADQLFSYLADVKRIENWDLTPGEKRETPMVESYLKFWKLLPTLYKSFKDDLIQDNSVYQGLAYREMAENMDLYLKKIKEKFTQVYFVGFSALNEAEEQILLKLYEHNIASFYWDIDAYYYDDVVHEAGKFLRSSKIIKRLKEKEEFYCFGDYLATDSKSLTIKSVSGDTLQAITANSTVLEYQESELEDIAVVMADENLLTPFLNNLASNISAVNVTMGLPLRYSPIAGFYHLLWEMQVWQEVSGRKDIKGNAAFHFQKWDDLLAHPVFKRLDTEGKVERVRAEIRKQNQVFISLETLQSWVDIHLDNEVKQLFESYTNTSGNWCKSLAYFTEYLKGFFTDSATEKGMLFGFFKLFGQLSELIDGFDFVVDIRTCQRFYKELLQTETIDLKGEPLKGLQVMGMLETRTLDFKNIILTSVNEDVLPKGRSQNSLIPFDIKHKFGLPTYLDKDGVFAYHFFRLLQRAENITIIYNNQNKGLGGGEPSRFIAQLEYEWCKVNPKIKLTKKTVSGKVTSELKEEKIIEKTPVIMNRLKELAEKGISPSALIDYINNPILFYYRRILGLQETDEVEEVIGYHTQGTVIHEILQDFYSIEENRENGPLAELNSTLTVFDKTEAELREEVVKRLHEFGLKDVSHGKNLLVRETLTGMLRNFLAREKEELKRNGAIKIHSLEETLSHSLILGNGEKVLIKGLADRIDQTTQGLRVIDYKTGGVHVNELKFQNFDDLKQPEEKNKSFQLMVYAYLYMAKHKEIENVNPAIISLRNVNEWPISLRYGKNEGLTQDNLEEFEAFLTLILEEIFNPEIPFSEKMLSLSKDV